MKMDMYRIMWQDSNDRLRMDTLSALNKQHAIERLKQLEPDFNHATEYKVSKVKGA